jgi:hypothetical protein
VRCARAARSVFGPGAWCVGDSGCGVTSGGSNVQISIEDIGPPRGRAIQAAAQPARTRGTAGIMARPRLWRAVNVSPTRRPPLPVNSTFDGTGWIKVGFWGRFVLFAPCARQIRRDCAFRWSCTHNSFIEYLYISRYTASWKWRPSRHGRAWFLALASIRVL